jgi:hypothetical protein
LEAEKSILYDVALNDRDLRQILSLQLENLASKVSDEVKLSEGFVTVQHDLPLLRSMNLAAKQIIARDQEVVIAYALAMRPEIRHMVPVLVPMFNVLDSLFYKGESLSNTRYYVMGQVCVDYRYRGQGIFSGLYNKHREVYANEYDFCVTEISTRNQRSMKAHAKVGFKTIHTFRDKTDEWNIVIWDWTK